MPDRTCPCPCPPEIECPDFPTEACVLAEAFRKDPPTFDPPVCGDLDATGNVVIGPNGDALCIVHEPLDPCAYRTSLAVRIQKTVDNARRRTHETGLRPYRVSLVWVRRDRRQVFQEYRRLELFPVTVSPLTDVDLDLRSIGLDQVGGIKLTRISPNQVDEFDLRGLIDGDPLPPDDQFFFEVVRNARFAGDRPQRNRFTIGSTPYYNAKKFQWEIDVVSQHARRDPDDGTDQTLDSSRRAPPRLLRLER